MKRLFTPEEYIKNAQPFIAALNKEALRNELMGVVGVVNQAFGPRASALLIAGLGTGLAFPDALYEHAVLTVVQAAPSDVFTKMFPGADRTDIIAETVRRSDAREAQEATLPSEAEEAQVADPARSTPNARR